MSWWIISSFILQFIARICKLVALPIAMSLIIARLSTGDYSGAQQAVLMFVGFSLLFGILVPLVKYLGIRGEIGAYSFSVLNYFKHLINTDLDFFNSNLSGYLTTSTRQYVDSCVNLVRSLRDKYLGTVLSIILPLIVILWVDWLLGVVTIFLSLVQAIYLLWASHLIDPHRTRARERYKRNSGNIADIISNVLAIKASAQEEQYVNQVTRNAHGESILFKRRHVLQSKLIVFRELITVLFFVALLWLTVQRMSVGALDIAGAVLVITYTTTILTAIYLFSENLDEHDDFVDKIIPAFDVLNRQNSVVDPEHPLSFNDVKGDIKFNGVSFSYEKKKRHLAVLKDFSLHIPAGQKVGVVGLSGAGKSTLTKLLLRFNDIDKGSIQIDDISISAVKQTDLRSKIAYVPQEPLLFHSSIKDNVLVTKPEAGEAEVLHALKTAHALSFVEKLPQGINSIVGERGVKLSGGQKQRIAIARAVLCDAPIIILDEATSALDSESEQIIKDSFVDILKGKTAIVVAHRLSTLSNMDRIIVIENGKLVEDGTHDQLVALKGAYAKLWRHQLRHLEE